jgi:hypothetical protein
VTNRRRLDRSRDRQLNRVRHTTVLTRARFGPVTREGIPLVGPAQVDYFKGTRSLAPTSPAAPPKGKTKREAKRYLNESSLDYSSDTCSHLTEPSCRSTSLDGTLQRQRPERAEKELLP